MAEQPTLINSVVRALNLLDAIGTEPDSPPSGWRAPSTCHCRRRATLLRTLLSEGYLDRVDGGYVLGERVSVLAARRLDPDPGGRAHHFSCSGIIAEGYPPALGMAFAFQRRGTDRIAVGHRRACGQPGRLPRVAQPRGPVKLPVVLVVEDNDWGISVPREDNDVEAASSSTTGLLDEFGPTRIIDTPISETAFIGLVVGAATEGMRPIAELMFADFLGVCLDQIYNHMAKINFESGGNVSVPMVLTAAVGGGYSDGAQHTPTARSTPRRSGARSRTCRG